MSNRGDYRRIEEYYDIHLGLADKLLFRQFVLDVRVNFDDILPLSRLFLNRFGYRSKELDRKTNYKDNHERRFASRY